jgi:hypothetical protein
MCIAFCRNDRQFTKQRFVLSFVLFCYIFKKIEVSAVDLDLKSGCRSEASKT